jgi:putative tricarboxylic transport membrane protein
VGYLFERFRFPIAPMVLGCILGPVAENSFMTSMIAYQNDWTIFFTRPISGFVMAMTFIALAWPLLRYLLSLLRARRFPSDIVDGEPREVER